MRNTNRLEMAVGHIPASAHADEAKPLAAELLRIQLGRRRGPQLLGDILPLVLARLGVAALQSGESGSVTPPSRRARESKTPFDPKGRTLTKHGALSDHPRYKAVVGSFP